VFVIGDLAALKDEHGEMLPGVAPVALQEGKWVAKTIGRDLEISPAATSTTMTKAALQPLDAPLVWRSFLASASRDTSRGSRGFSSTYFF